MFTSAQLTKLSYSAKPQAMWADMDIYGRTDTQVMGTEEPLFMGAITVTNCRSSLLCIIPDLMLDSVEVLSLSVSTMRGTTFSWEPGEGDTSAYNHSLQTYPSSWNKDLFDGA